ncbi:MAG: nitroreductase family protein [Candidatus Freyarchaeota archaeon]|nr:nitroreductase family protein [Candidatus Jordarchaeia archaeon]MBS7281602.1 nitroreductase family protein [Candidatus Jordarchaeia archaeon]
MDVFEAIENRRSIRDYDRSKPVSKEIIEKIVNAARWAPTAGNRQPIEVIVVSSQEVREKLASLSGYAPYLKDSPVALVVCVNQSKYTKGYENARQFYTPMDASAAIMNMMLAAHGLGLGTCWDSVLDKKAIRELLKIPEHVEPFSILALGYPSKRPETPPRRRPLEEMIHWEAY